MTSPGAELHPPYARSITGRRPRLRPIVRWLACLLVVTGGALTSAAHTLGESYVYLQVGPAAISGRFEVALKDLNAALGWNDTDRRITRRNLTDRVAELQAYYLERVHFTTGSTEVPIRFTSVDLLMAHGGYVQLGFDLVGLDEVPSALDIEYSVLLDEDPGHRGFVLVEHNWATGTFGNESHISGVLSPGSRHYRLDLTSSGVWRGFLGVVALGIEHIWTGYDHVMFLVALLLPAVLRREDGTWHEVERFVPALVNVLKIVTAFTVAHSVTLTLAALGVIRLPERLVEVAIAVSIAAAAADILVPLFRGRVWLVVFGFGLFHGFGFAAALANMGVLGEHLGLSLFGFNLGVEIGQIAIAAVLFPILFMVRRLALYRQVALRFAAVVMVLVSSAWVVERAFDVDVPMYAMVKPLVDTVRR